MARETFKILNAINLEDKGKTKVGLSYLSWADAWKELLTHYPEAYWTIYTRSVKFHREKTENDPMGGTIVINESYINEVPYFTDGKTCYVKVGVTIEGREEIEYLPVMDYRNQAVRLEVVTMTHINNSIQRAFVKACARHGLGLHFYSGEDLKEMDKKEVTIDFAKIGENCDRFQTVTLTQEAFDKMKEDVINDIQASYPEEVANAIITYVTKTSGGKKLSQFDLEHDTQNLQRIYNFLNEIKKLLAASDGK